MAKLEIKVEKLDKEHKARANMKTGSIIFYSLTKVFSRPLLRNRIE